jgi:hypothetical protein
MPHKCKPAAATRQAPPPPPWNTPAFAEQTRASSEQFRASLQGRYEFKHPPLAKLVEEFRLRKPDPHKLGRLLDLADLDRFSPLAASLQQLLRECGSAAPPTEQNAPAAAKRKTSNVDIPHTDDAIKQMRSEKPLTFVKQEVARVIDILKTEYQVHLPTKQEKTVRRRIADWDKLNR